MKFLQTAMRSLYSGITFFALGVIFFINSTSLCAEFPDRILEWTLEEESRLQLSTLPQILGERTENLRCFDIQEGYVIRYRRDQQILIITLIKTGSPWAAYGVLGLKAHERRILGTLGFAGFLHERGTWWNYGPFVYSISMKNGPHPELGSVLIQAVNHVLYSWEDCVEREPELPGTDRIPGSLRVQPLLRMFLDAGITLNADVKRMAECHLVQIANYVDSPQGSPRLIAVLPEYQNLHEALMNLGKPSCPTCLVRVEAGGTRIALLMRVGKKLVCAIVDKSDGEAESWLKELPW